MYSALVTALKASTVPFAEFAWEHAPQTGAYGTVELDMGAASVWADDAQLEQALSGTVDLYVRGTGRTEYNIVENVLKAQGVSWSLYSIQYEEGRHLVHYQWTFEIEAY